MWNDLIRRWLDMAFWWLPGQNAPEERSQRGRQASAPPAREQEAEPPRAQAQTRPEPEPRPEEQPRPAPAAQPQTPDAPEPAPAAAASGPDDLTEIKGIGAAMQRRLNAHGIRSFADLAAADPDRLLQQLKEDKAVISEARLKEWIQAARERAGG